MASQTSTRPSWVSMLPFFSSHKDEERKEKHSDDEDLRSPPKAPKWSFGVLNAPDTIEVPGSVLLLSNHRNEPLGLRNAPGRTSHSSIATGAAPERPLPKMERDPENKKKTSDGKIILEPQPEDSANDPLNWPTWRRDSALLSLGLYCMIGGGMTPILAAGFSNVANDYGVSVSRVSLTTGLFMMGMGVGSVFVSPTAILWGKRPVYLVSAVLFIVSSVWCAVSPSFGSLLAARVFQGIAVSPVEALPSASIAEIFFLHERAFRIGIYTLLLLSGKNLTPLVSAAIIQQMSWQWVFWIVAMVVAFCGILLFIFVPETFWDRAPVPRSRMPSRPTSFVRRLSSKFSTHGLQNGAEAQKHDISSVTKKDHLPKNVEAAPGLESDAVAVASEDRAHHIQFSPVIGSPKDQTQRNKNHKPKSPGTTASEHDYIQQIPNPSSHAIQVDPSETAAGQFSAASHVDESQAVSPARSPSNHSLRSPWSPRGADPEKQEPPANDSNAYSKHWREREAKSFVQQLRPYHGRLNSDNWLKVAIRPFILYSYPSVLWSAAVYSCSIGWLIVVSESVTVIYRQRYYQLNALQTGLMYISPFIGGVLGTAVAGKVSDIVVKAMARRNGGLYEPEFRLVMAVPIAITTVIGLIGYGWSAEERDSVYVPTVFFGIISFGCSLGSTTSITFCVDSYRQYAGEALVTLNFSKNIFHGLVFSFFVTEWIEEDGSKDVFIWIGVIQLIILAFTVPMFIYGKRARQWTVRKNFMEKF